MASCGLLKIPRLSSERFYMPEFCRKTGKIIPMYVYVSKIMTPVKVLLLFPVQLNF